MIPLEKLHTELSKDFDLGSLEEFALQMSSHKNRLGFFKQISKTHDIGKWADFESEMIKVYPQKPLEIGSPEWEAAGRQWYEGFLTGEKEIGLWDLIKGGWRLFWTAGDPTKTAMALSGERLSKSIPFTKLFPDEVSENIAYRFGRGFAEGVEAITAPENIAIMASGSFLTGMASQVFSGTFAIDMGRAAIEQTKELTDAIKRGDKGDAAEAIGGLLTTGYFTYKSTKYAVKGKKVTPKDIEEFEVPADLKDRIAQAIGEEVSKKPVEERTALADEINRRFGLKEKETWKKELPELLKDLTEEEIKAKVGEVAKYPIGMDLLKRKLVEEERISKEDISKLTPEQQKERRATIIEAFKETFEAFKKLSESSLETLGSLGAFSEEGYQRAKPHLQKAWDLYKTAGRNYSKWAEDMEKMFGETIAPYIKAFRDEHILDIKRVPEVGIVAKTPQLDKMLKDLDIKITKVESIYERVKPDIDKAWTLYRKGGGSINEFNKILQDKFGDKFTFYLDKWTWDKSNIEVMYEGVTPDKMPYYQRSINAIGAYFPRLSKILNGIYILNEDAWIKRYKGTPMEHASGGLEPTTNAIYFRDIYSVHFESSIMHELRHLYDQVKGRPYEYELLHKERPSEIRAYKTEKISEKITKVMYDASKATKLVVKAIEEAANESLKAVGTFGAFTEEGYQKAKPYLQEAWSLYKSAGRDFAKWSNDMRKQFGDNISPFIKRFESDFGITKDLYSLQTIAEKSKNFDDFKSNITAELPSYIAGRTTYKFNKKFDINQSFIHEQAHNLEYTNTHIKSINTAFEQDLQKKGTVWTSQYGAYEAWATTNSWYWGGLRDSAKEQAPNMVSLIENKTVPEVRYKSLKQFWEEIKKLPISNVDKVLEIKKTEIMTKSIKQTLTEEITDKAGYLKRQIIKTGGEEGRQAVMRFDLMAGATPKALEHMADAHSNIYHPLKRQQVKSLDELILKKSLLRTDVSKELPGVTSGDLNADLRKITDPVVLDAYEKYAKTFRTEVIESLWEEGIINEAGYEFLLSRPFYDVLRQLRPLKYGKKGIEHSSELVLSESMTAAQNMIFKNKANASLINLAEVHPDNGIVSLYEGKGKAPTGWTKINSVVEGKKREAIMPSVLAKEWNGLSPHISPMFSNILGWLTGAKITKFFATGINPGFALTNMPRDIVHIFSRTNIYSPHIPIFLWEIGKDLQAVKSDVFKRKGLYKEFVDRGGSMDYMTSQGLSSHTYKGVFHTINKYGGWLGKTSEIWTRLALMKHALDKGKSLDEATWLARDYLDFSQGGRFIKAIDAGVPYLSAGIQATRGLFKAAQENPRVFIWKMAQLGLLSFGAYMASRTINKEAYDQISDEEKSNYLILTYPISKKDKTGLTRWMYSRLPLDTGQKAVNTVFRGLAALAYGDDFNFVEAAKSAASIFSILPTNLTSPLPSAIWGYLANHDWWKGEPIWQGPDVAPPSAEWDKFTSPLAVKVGDLTGFISPERATYFLKQLITSSNTFTEVSGSTLKLLLSELTPTERDEVMYDLASEAALFGKLVKWTNPYINLRKERLEAKRAETSIDFAHSQKFNRMFEVYWETKQGEDLNKIVKFINELPYYDAERFIKKFEDYSFIYPKPDRTWWLSTLELNPEARAEAFYTRWAKSKKDDQQVLINSAFEIPGYGSDRFIIRFNELKHKTKP